MTASLTPLPVFGVPVQSKALSGEDSLLSIVQMPKGVAVGTLAIGAAGAYNAGLLAAQMLASDDPALQKRIADWKAARADQVLADAELGHFSRLNESCIGTWRRPAWPDDGGGRRPSGTGGGPL